MIDGIKTPLSSTTNHLNWQFDGSVTTDAMSRELVTDEQAWAVVQVNPNVSLNLDAGLRSGSASYNSLSAVTIYFETGRNQITLGSIVLPAVLAVINPLLTELGTQHTNTFLGANAGNATAVQAAVRCKSCLFSPFAATQVDILPFDVQTAMGPTMTGLNYLLTTTFDVFQYLRNSAQIVGAELDLTSSLLFGFVDISVLVHCAELHAYQPGFRVGLPMESLFTLIGIKWAGFFLNFWIVINAASSFTSFELMPTFYQYGYAFPFFNLTQGTRTIIFGNKSHLGQNFGILIAWMVIGMIGIVIFTELGQKQNRKKNKHEVR
ncbi:hypothetical protein MMC13_005895 [Lambiella insularis]|nr:hypothetical protein [Lambiella insularis]